MIVHIQSDQQVMQSTADTVFHIKIMIVLIVTKKSVPPSIDACIYFILHDCYDG